MSALELITSSRLKAFRRCARYHRIRYELGYKPLVESEALRFGTLVHAGLEAWWRALQAMPAVWTDVAVEAVLEAALVAVAGASDPFERIRAEELLRGYHFRWIDAGLEVIAVEVEFIAPLVNPATGAASRTYERAGKIDVLARDDSGVVLIEHKTSSEDIGVGSTYWTRLRMDSQVSTYFDGGAALGHDVRACIYDVVGKVALRPMKATPAEERQYTKEKRDKAGNVTEPSRLYAKQRETDETAEEYRARVREAIASEPDRYYQRGPVVRLEEELDEHRFDVWQTAKTMRESQLAGRAPRNPDACSMYGRTCEFFGVCSGAASLDDETQFVRLASPHPELAQASQTAPAGAQEA